MTNGVLVQYLGVLLIGVVAYQEVMAKTSPDGRTAPLMIYWIAAVLVFGIGTVTRLMTMSRDSERNVRRRWPARAVPPRTTPGTAEVPAVEVDPATLITPAMLDELRASRPWINIFEWITGISAGLMMISGLMQMIAAIFDGRRESLLLGFATAFFMLLLGSLNVMLFSYVRQHVTAIGAVRATLTESSFSTIVDSQRRIWRFFGVMLSFVGVVFFLAFIGGIVLGLSKGFQ